MAKTKAFYERYVLAVFNRGKADTLPEKYIDHQMGQVLKKDEEKAEFKNVLKEYVDKGILTLARDEYTLNRDRLPKEEESGEA